MSFSSFCRSPEARSQATESREVRPADSDEAAVQHPGRQGGRTQGVHPKLRAEDEGERGKPQAGIATSLPPTLIHPFSLHLLLLWS